MADQVKYPHQAYMQKHHIRMPDLPADIREMIAIWNIDWQDHTPKTIINPSLKRASDAIQEEIEKWQDEDEDDDLPTTPAKKQVSYKGNDAVLHALMQAGKTQVTVAELKEAGYKRDLLGGLPLSTAHHALKSVKGAKNTYQICNR